MILRDKDKKSLLAIFSTLNIPVEIWAFGSRVSGEAHEGSDLDLVIRTHNLQKLSNETFLNLKAKIQQSNIPILVELFDWNHLPKGFLKNIENNHELLFSNLSMATNNLEKEIQ
ncbi:MAG: nucleotidyltransferase domain-containing protein [Bacteroidia bacterium]|nr:nucleotidyltransferase domain-containing protein [Bacteroidia bacterium]